MTPSPHHPLSRQRNGTAQIGTMDILALAAVFVGIVNLAARYF